MTCLYTEIGPINLGLKHQSTAAAQAISPGINSFQGQLQDQLVLTNTKNDLGYALSSDKCWITWNGHNIL